MSSSHSDLVMLVQKGDQNAYAELVEEYSSVIRRIVNSLDVDNSEKEDLYQEGLIGLYKATLAYNPNVNASFNTFARICIKHSVISALRTYYSKKNSPLFSSLPIDVCDGETEKVQGLGTATDPECLLIAQEAYQSLLKVIDVNLSKLERNVLKLFVQGMSYGEISGQLHISIKSVGNAIQRIRGKLKLLIQP